MTVSAPPRPPEPPSTAPDPKPLDREEVEALVKALIEEVRRETRRRRRRYWVVAAFVALVGVVVLIVLEGGAASQTASPGLSARMSVGSQTGASRIAFVGGVLKPSPSGGFFQTDLYVMNADGSGLRRVFRHARGSTGPEPYGGGPVWSPDGRKLAFVKRLGPAVGQCQVCTAEIFVMNADGSGQQNLTGNLGGTLPVWSPNGQEIAFFRDSGFRPYLYVMNADGSGQRRVTQDSSYGSTWSPDGRRLAFTSGFVPGNPGNSEIYVVNVDGTSLQQLTRDPGPDQNPAWSPDGRTIAFQSYREARPLGRHRWQKVMHVMNADGSGQRRLTGLSESDGSFSWSPDGRRIAFVSDRDGND
jgi:Tol biopolymer transport system component